MQSGTPFRSQNRDLQAEAAAEKASLAAEWQKMQGMGRVLTRKKLIATVAAVSIVFVGIAGSVAVVVLLSGSHGSSRGSGRIVALPIAVSALIAAAVRKALWPKGQFT